MMEKRVEVRKMGERQIKTAVFIGRDQIKRKG
jgi:hypothetical protein